MARSPDNAWKWSIVALLVIVGTTVIAATSPGFLARISQKGLDFACVQGVAVLKKDLETISIPDLAGSFKIKLVGKGEYSFYSISVVGFQLPRPQIRPKRHQGLQLSINNISIQISGRWKASKRFFKASGRFDLSIENVSIWADLRLGINPTSNHLTIACYNCTSHITRVRLRILDSMLGWMIRLFRKKIEHSLRDTLNNKICNIVTESVSSKLQPYLQTLPAIVKVDEVAGIDYTLVSPLTITEESVNVQLKGEFFRLTHHKPPPFVPPLMGFTMDSFHMVYLGVSDYFFNTAGLVYFEAGVFKMILSDHMMPRNSDFQLTTAYFGTFLPEMAKKFPNLEVQLIIALSTPPHLTTQPSGLTFTLILEVQAFAILQNSSLAPLFVLSMSTNASLEVGTKSNRLIGELKMHKLLLELKQSYIGEFQVELLQAIMDFLVPTVVMQKVNTRLLRGVPLPVPSGVQLFNLLLLSRQDFLLLGADIHGN